MRSIKSGFTLIELLVVMAIIAVLAAIIVPKVSGAKARAERLSCSSNMRGIVRGMQMYEEDWTVACVQDTANDDTLDIFGRLYYLEDDAKTGDKKTGITTMKIYNCPSSSTTPPSVNGYKQALTMTAPEGIDYGIVLTGNTPAFQNDPDKNAILIETSLDNHNGRNVTFWDSTTKFIPKADLTKATPDVPADMYPNNVDKATGSENATEIYAIDQVITESGKNSAALDT